MCRNWDSQFCKLLSLRECTHFGYNSRHYEPPKRINKFSASAFVLFIMLCSNWRQSLFESDCVAWSVRKYFNCLKVTRHKRREVCGMYSFHKYKTQVGAWNASWRNDYIVLGIYFWLLVWNFAFRILDIAWWGISKHCIFDQRASDIRLEHYKNPTYGGVWSNLSLGNFNIVKPKKPMA